MTKFISLVEFNKKQNLKPPHTLTQAKLKLMAVWGAGKDIDLNPRSKIRTQFRAPSNSTVFKEKDLHQIAEYEPEYSRSIVSVDDTCYVYLILNYATDTCKIGVAKSPEERMKALLPAFSNVFGRSYLKATSIQFGSKAEALALEGAIHTILRYKGLSKGIKSIDKFNGSTEVFEFKDWVLKLF